MPGFIRYVWRVWWRVTERVHTHTHGSASERSGAHAGTDATPRPKTQYHTQTISIPP